MHGVGRGDAYGWAATGRLSAWGQERRAGGGHTRGNEGWKARQPM